MYNKMDICIVCLRADLGLKRIDPRVTDFHEELCDYSYSSHSIDLKFCMQCEHLLKKLYSFKEKCVEAINILQKWKMNKSDKKPLNLLYTLLPQSGLGMWTPKNAKTFYFQEERRRASRNMKRKANRKLLPKDSVLPLSSVYVPRPLTSEPVEKSISNEDIKLEDCKDGSQFREIETVLIRENQSKHQDSDNNYAVSEKCNIQQQKNDDVKLVECLDDSIPISDDDTEVDNILDDTVLNSDDIETDCSVNSDVIHEEDEDLEESSKDSADEELTETKRHPAKRNNSVAESANDGDDETGIEDADLNDDGTECNIANKIIVDMENINAELDSLNDDFEKIVIQTGNSIQNKEVASIRRKKKKKPLTLRGFAKIFKIVNVQMDGIEGNCRNIIGDEPSVPELSSIGEATMRALIENIKAKFENCAELKLESGVLIDKEHILNCLDGKVSDYMANWLWRAVKGKKHLTPKAIKILGLIQGKYDTSKYESVFEIEYLNSTEAKKEEFQRRQTYPWYLESKHKCEICYTAFRFEKHLEKHIKICHVESAGNLICPICGVRDKLKRAHKNHLRYHEAVYKCKQCPLVTYYKDNMRNHYDQHMGVKYTCEPCDKIFPSASAYNTHRAYRHGRPRECTACGAAFRTPDALDAHRTHCKSEPPADGSTSVKCDKCELSFPSQQVHERHYRRAHGDGFYKNRVSTIHARKESKNSIKTGRVRKVVYSCPVCHAAGTTYGWLVLHGRLEHNKDLSETYAAKRRHLCDVCGKGFLSKYSLRDHLNTHTGERPFACDKCPKRFHSAAKLSYHQQYHAPPTFVCAQCGKKFHTHANLYRHTQGHTGNRRYKCDICGKGFFYSCALNEHIRGVHNNVRRVKKRVVTEEVGNGVTEEVGKEVTGWLRVTEAAWKGETEAEAARTSTAMRAKRLKVRKVTSAGESGDSD